MSTLRSPRIGLFDSGIGGFTVLRHVLEACPGVPCVYFGDLKHVPYGRRELPEIRSIAADIIRFLESQGCTHLAVACNTSTAALMGERPPTALPAVDVIEPLGSWIAERARTRRVGVVANPTTANRGIHAQVLQATHPGLEVTTQGAPTLVDLLESHAPESAVDAAVAEAVAPLIDAGVQAVVYGCTHYPLARPSFERALGPAVELVDTGWLVAQRLATLIRSAGSDRPGRVEFITSAPSTDFERWIGDLFPADLQWSLRVEELWPAVAEQSSCS
ncbi:MAG TPA: aspartate/glutamate racemase family protein [bacterium]|nr:aspartate/glutamate racemase family protein [bacterium]